MSRSRLSVICQSAGRIALESTRAPEHMLKALPLVLQRLNGCFEVARPAGFEPATFGSGEGDREKTRGYLRQSGQCFRDLLEWSDHRRPPETAHECPHSVPKS